MPYADAIERSCLTEATARKPGNVHPAAVFVDLTYADFVRAAAACAGPLALSSDGLGRAVFRAVAATRDVAPSNVNLGIALLLAPLAAVPASTSLRDGIKQILSETTVADAEQVYAAIRSAQPGGLGEVSDQDIQTRPTVTLRDAMKLAVDRDTIAAEYVHNFSLTLDFAVPRLRSHWDRARTICPDATLGGLPCPPWETAVIRLACDLIAHTSDSLVARKCGPEIARELRERARDVVTANWPESPGSESVLARFDAWLRADGHRRNPGTTADLVAAALYAAHRDHQFPLPTVAELNDQALRIQKSRG